MSEIKVTIYEQLQQLQMLMHRASFGKIHNPHRGQGRVLALLKLKPEISQKELTYLLNVSKQAAAELITKLEKNGHITREPLESDKRIMIIKLTDKGAKVADELSNTDLETDKTLDCLNDDELATFSEYLERIITQYEDQFPEMDFKKRRQRRRDFMLSHGHGHSCRHGHSGHGFRKHRHSSGHGCGGHGHNSSLMRHFPFKNGGCNNGDNGQNEEE